MVKRKSSKETPVIESPSVSDEEIDDEDAAEDDTEDDDIDDDIDNEDDEDFIDNEDDEHGSAETVIGYGTFISGERFKGKKNVRVVTVKGFRRVFDEKVAFFPFALPEPDSSFKAIGFDVPSTELRYMDGYEACGEDPLSPKDALYYRIKVDAETAEGEKINGWMYIPGDRSYREVKLKVGYDLSPEIDTDDKWLDNLRKRQYIVDDVPELFN